MEVFILTLFKELNVDVSCHLKLTNLGFIQPMAMQVIVFIINN